MKAKVLDWIGLGSHDQGHGHSHAHGHSHGPDGGHGHTHGVIDATIASTAKGIWALKWSFVMLVVTGLIQIAAVFVSGSVALLADTIHNFADATTALPLWLAFALARRPATRRFPYGLGRVEDLAGILIVLIILFSAVVAGYEAFGRLIHPQPVTNLGWLTLAGLIGFAGNEVVAVFRIRVGREINSAALIADGYHARTDGLTSLAVVAGAFCVWLGFPLADPLIGLAITVVLLVIVWQSAQSVLTRMLDGVDPGLIDEIEHAAQHVAGIAAVTEARARWLGHKLHVEVAIAADEGLSLAEAMAVAGELEHELFHHIPALSVAKVRFAPASGHGHAPAAVRVDTDLARGVLQIVDTEEGERMRFLLSRHAEGLEAEVRIERDKGRMEHLPLTPVNGDPHLLRSSAAPEEPHSFSATLILRAGDTELSHRFEMDEPDHAH
ncbi:cation diffusion facilitator family transporter [bacterium]|nr:cation diffusion facilitator family transporter [bacterium]